MDEYEPFIEDGFLSIKFYSYVADLDFMLKYASDWLEKHKEYDLMDIAAGADEGTYVTFYCKRRR
jgi:hypothetical protein